MKEVFEKAAIQYVDFLSEDVITASGQEVEWEDQV